MTATILITGATGNISSQVVLLLKKSGASVRALVRDVNKAEALKNAGAELVVGDFNKPETLWPAFEGASTVLMLTPPHPQAAEFGRNLIAAAKKTKPHVVRISVVKAGVDGPTENVRLHGETEKDLQASGLKVTYLRPNFFMQNLFMSAQSIGSDGVFYMGMGEGKLSMIDVRDIVDVSVKVLLDPAKHVDKVYELSGPAAINFHDVAKAFSAKLGHEVKYIPVTPEQVEQTLIQLNLGDWFPKVMAQYSRAYASGWGNLTTKIVEEIAGHPARSIETFAEEVFKPSLTRK